jgi:hypothetical protein
MKNMNYSFIWKDLELQLERFIEDMEVLLETNEGVDIKVSDDADEIVETLRFMNCGGLN